MLSIIQIAPIKVNPWSAIASAIGKALNHDMISRIESLDNKIQDLDEKIDGVRSEIAELDTKVNKMDEKNLERDAVTSRVRILKFCDEMQGGIRHSKDSFDQVMSDITHYNNYCLSHPTFKNNQTASTVDYISACYRTRLAKRDFSTFRRLHDIVDSKLEGIEDIDDDSDI